MSINARNDVVSSFARSAGDDARVFSVRHSSSHFGSTPRSPSRDEHLAQRQPMPRTTVAFLDATSSPEIYGLLYESNAKQVQRIRR
jgi:hypothetical protein